MEIRVLPRIAVDTKNQIDKVLISIYGKGETKLENKYFDCLYLKIDDITYNYPDYTLFNKKHFAQIVYFFNKYKNKDIDIHCTAGISRSGAIALGLCLLMNDRDKYFNILNNSFILPNEYILAYFQYRLKRYWFRFYDTYKAIEIRDNKFKQIGIEKDRIEKLVNNFETV